jgi:hypothetical protein
VPRNERNDSTAKSRISPAAWAQRDTPAATARAAAGASRIGSTTNSVTARIAPATTMKVG